MGGGLASSRASCVDGRCPRTCHVDEFNHERLHRYCVEALEAQPTSLPHDREEAARTCLAKWVSPPPIRSGIKEMLHNILLPNHMSLLRAARSLDKGEPFIGKFEAEYTTVVLESMAAIFRVRDEIGIRPLHAMTLLSPAIILAEPALMRFAYQKMKPKGPLEEKVVAQTLRLLQAQKGLEPPRVCRRPFCLSHAAMAGSSSCA